MMADKKSVDAAATGTTADCTSGTSETKVRPDVHGGDGAGAGLTRQDDIVDIAAMTHTGRFPIGHYSPRHVADSPQDGSVAAQSVNQWPRERASSIQLPAPLTPPVYSELPVTASLTAAGSSDVLPVSSKAEVVVGLLQQVAIARNPSSASSGSRRKLTTAEAAGRQPIESATECSSEEALNSVSAARAVTVTGGSVECLPSHSTLYSGNRVASSEALTRPSSNCITAAIIHVDSDGDATRFSQRRTEGEPFLPPPPSYNVASAMPTRGGHCRLVQHQSFNRQHSTPASLRHHQLFGSSSVIYRRKRVLEVPFDENNVPQIDRAVTPPPGLSFSYSSTASALAHAAAAVDQTSGTVSTAPSEMSPLQTATLTQTVPAVSAGISGFAAGPSDSASTTKKQTSGKTGSTSGPPPIYARRFASLRIPARSGKSKGDRCGGEVTALVGGSAAARINGSQLYRTSTLAGVRSRSNTSGHGAELNSNYGSQLSVSSALSGLKTQDCRYAKMQLLQNIGDDISLYGTPKEELSPTVPPKSVNFANDLRDQLIAMFQPSDNKLAMKLFGNKNALLKEKMRQKAVGKWVIHPCSNFRFYWDVVMLVLLIANLIILPVAISFFNDDLSVQWIVFNGLSDTVFMLDLVINFRTGIIADNFADEIILEPHEIARRYLRSWFLLDLVSSIPLDYFILLFSPDANLSQLIHAGRALKVFRLVKLLSLLRLLRLSRLVRYVSQWEEFLTVASKFMRIFNLVCLILLLGHWNGCLQWLVPMLQDFPSNSWPALEELQHADWLEQYTWALFKALSHMLCIGFGRYPPQSTTDVWLTMISMLTGATCYALFVGHSTTLIQSFDTSKRLYREKFKQVEEYMAYRKLHRDLRQKISDYYEHRFRGKMFDEKRILEEVNECLKEEIVNYNCRALVAAVPFFTHADPNFVTDVVTKLEYEVFQPGDYIIKEGTVGTKMYFIQEGIVDIVTKNGEVATSLSDGSYFGEICLLTNSRRVASVRAESYCSLFSLSVDQFHSVLEHYPVMRRTLESVAAQRLNKIGKNPSIVSTREDFEDDINTVNELLMHGATDQSSVEGDDGSQEQEHDRAGKKRKIGSGKDSSGKLLLKFPLALKKKRHSHDDSSGHDDV